MTTSQWWVDVAIISPTLNQPLHPEILQQKLIAVTSDFLSPATFFVWQKQGRWWQDLLYSNLPTTTSSTPDNLSDPLWVCEKNTLLPLL